MAPKQEISLVYKPKGMTMGQLVENFKSRFSEYIDTPVTYAGRLDPLAEGLVILLSGGMVHRKQEFLNLDKEYEFEFVLGFRTDTYDILGLVEESEKLYEFNNDNFSKIIDDIRQIRVQSYPPFSSKNVNGKPLFQWSREGRIHEIDIPERVINIRSVDLLKQEKLSSTKLLEKILISIEGVSGDFRQDEIKDNWLRILSENEKEYFLFKMKAVVSSGTYIRGLVNEIGNKLGTGAVTVTIKRNRIGDYKLE
jgi:tRNA pseudouridine55 synthase